MKKNTILKKTIITILLILLCFVMLSNYYKVNAEGEDGFSAAPLDGFDKSKDELGISEVTGTVDSLTATIMTIVRTVSVAIAIVMLLVIGMKYMIASPGDRADIKKHAVAYVIGAFILFGVSGILTMLLTFGQQISSGGTTES